MESLTLRVAGAREALAVLRERGLRLGLISNTGSLTRADLLRMLPSDFQFGGFDEDLVLLSSEVGIEKPDIQMFQLALERTRQHDEEVLGPRADPAECLYCSESAVEMLVAQRAGMRGFRVTDGSAADMGMLINTLIEAGLLRTNQMA